MSVAMALTNTLLSHSNKYGPADNSHVKDDAPVPWSLRRRCTVDTYSVAGIDVYTLTPKRGAADIDILYFHGGAYNAGMIAPHWWVVRSLVAATGATVHVPSYLLAPEHTADAAYPSLDAVTDDVLLAAGTRRVVFAGDSAGGGIALAEAQRCRDKAGKNADHLVLFSPWVDVTMTNPAARDVEERDVSLNCDLLAAAGRWWAGDRDPADPLISPSNGDLVDLPPMTVVQGGRDVLAPDVIWLVGKVRDAGGRVHLAEAAEGFHVYVAGWWTPEARAALRLAAQGIRGDGE
ncbi:MAG TPA: alpha/beta hydrolase [Dietzia timorensis]|uniref:Alpha/beta hydrolase n=1 Tax=Dietzia timorensis TaxID=499555 RepID=A0A921F420_9ACTN|nr:alpha/beta hydrolase fold domain-containing protein [Dietzia timorensis]HJE90129.1 alpha/beta hydrolase [Dietzia timorensis]